MNNFDEYKRLGEPLKKEKSELWETAIGLQQVDGLTPSEYLIETAKANIEGDITFSEVNARINTYYTQKSILRNDDDRTEEADKVSASIAEILAEKTFVFSPAEYITIHKRLFAGIYKFAGKIRDYNISKDEWVLGGDTVYYASADSIRATLDYDFSQEKIFDYKNLSKSQMAEHFANFISGIWQIHAFGEGNTRTTAVFAIKYLRTFGFNVNNNLFAENSWYFRNALVRANYSNHKLNVYATSKYLNSFFGNLLLGEKNILKNREICISVDTVKAENDTVKAENDTVKAENDTVKAENDTVKAENDTVKVENDTVFDLITSNNKITTQEISHKLGISLSTAKRKIKKLKESKTIERVGSDKAGYWKILEK